MTNEHNEQAILLLHTLRTGYICDPKGCKFTKCDENCILCDCDNYHDALAFAIDCIEKQTPKKPTEYDNCGNITATDRCCLCNEIVYREYTHCPYCGQRISWEVE